MNKDENLFKSEQEKSKHESVIKKALESDKPFLSDKEIKDRKRNNAFKIYQGKKSNSSSKGQNFNRRGNTRGR